MFWKISSTFLLDCVVGYGIGYRKVFLREWMPNIILKIIVKIQMKLCKMHYPAKSVLVESAVYDQQ